MNLFDFDDILIQPEVISPIRSRSEVEPRYLENRLPLMTAPMDTVINEKNKDYFIKEGFIPILPRIFKPDLDYVSTNTFLSYSMTDFERIFMVNTPQIMSPVPIMALIDVANGHMSDLLLLTKEAKKKYGNDLTLMVGNVANPDTFMEYCRTNVDYVRIGIGNGNGCLTTVQTGIGYPMASLIRECYDYRKMNSWASGTKIVADGGFKKYADIIKALALGADYVMLGSVLNKALESCGETTQTDEFGAHFQVDQYSKHAMDCFNVDIPLYKVFRGMSTKEVQKDWGKKDLTTSEGVVRQHRVEYTLSGWVKNFESYLKSTMSYTARKNLSDFIGKVKCNFITQNAYNRFNK